MRSRWTVRTPLVTYARGVRKREAAEERKAAKREERRAAAEARSLEGQRNWCEANGYGRVTFAERDAARKAERHAELAEAAKVMKHVGEVGKRIDLELTVVKITPIEGRFGDIRYLHIFVDVDGNRFTYWRDDRLHGLDLSPDGLALGGEAALVEGYEFTAKWTVKKHDMYSRRGSGDPAVPQTVLQRPYGVKPTTAYEWQMTAASTAA